MRTLMTYADRLRPPQVGLAPLLVLCAALTYGGGYWLNLLHTISNEPIDEFLAGPRSWMSEATLALPLIAAMTWLAFYFAARLAARSSGAAAPEGIGIAEVALVALFTSASIAVATPIRELLFAPEIVLAQNPFVCSILGVGAESGLTVPLLSMAHDGMSILPANLVIVLLCLGVFEFVLKSDFFTSRLTR